MIREFFYFHYKLVTPVTPWTWMSKSCISCILLTNLYIYMVGRVPGKSIPGKYPYLPVYIIDNQGIHVNLKDILQQGTQPVTWQHSIFWVPARNTTLKWQLYCETVNSLVVQVFLKNFFTLYIQVVDSVVIKFL